MDPLTLKLVPDGSWAVLTGPMHPRLVSTVRQLRRSAREFDGKQWRVHYGQLPVVAGLAQRLYHHVDWSELPPQWQVLACGGAPAAALEDPYAVLHLLPSAPVEVARAAYRVLALKAHPDHGGDPGEMQRLNRAIEAILAGS